MSFSSSTGAGTAGHLAALQHPSSQNSSTDSFGGSHDHSQSQSSMHSHLQRPQPTPHQLADQPQQQTQQGFMAGRLVPPNPDGTWTMVPSGERLLVDNTGQQIKRKRPQSCDTCRQRKIKCVRLHIEGLENSSDQRCVQCRAINTQCTYTYIPRRPGPQTSANKIGKKELDKATKLAKLSAVKAKQAAKQEAGSGVGVGCSASRSNSSGQVPLLPTPPASNGHEDETMPRLGLQMAGVELSSASTSGFALPSAPAVQSGFGSSIPSLSASSSSAPSSSFLGQQPQAPTFSVGAMLGSAPAAGSFWGAREGLSVPPPVPGLATTPAPQLQPPQQHRSLVPQTMSMPRGPVPGLATSMPATLPQVKAPPAHLGRHFAAPTERPRSLADIAPRQTFYSIIAIYFQHLYALMPMVHRPTFSHDLLTCRDAHDEDFLAFVLSLTAYTLVQAPRSVIPAPWPFYRRLHKICHLTSRRLQPRRYDPPRLIHLCTLYADHIYLGSTGWNNAANATLGEAVRTAFTLGIHDERRAPSTGKLDVGSSSVPEEVPQRSAIETQLRRRLYWLIYGSDKTIAVLQDEPISLRDDDSWGVQIPLAIDDDCLTAAGPMPQPPERGTSILCGFEAVTKLHMLLSEMLEAFRADKRRPPTDYAAATARSQNAKHMQRRIQQILAEMAEPLQAPPAPASSDHNSAAGSSARGQQQTTTASGFALTAPQPSVTPSSLNGSSSSSTTTATTPQIWTQQPSSSTSSSPFGVKHSELSFSPWSTGTLNTTSGSLPSHETGGPATHSQPSSSVHASPSSYHAVPLGSHTHHTPASNASSFSLNDFGDFSAASSEAGHQGPMQPQPQASHTQPPSAEQLSSAMDRVDAFRPSPPPMRPSQGPILSPFATMRANILITETMLRFVLAEYREFLDNVLNACQDKPSGPVKTDDWESAAGDMVGTLNSMPLESLAANGQSMIAKLVYLTSSLLSRSQPGSRGSLFLGEFLSTLTRLTSERQDGSGAAVQDDEDEDEDHSKL